MRAITSGPIVGQTIDMTRFAMLIISFEISMDCFNLISSVVQYKYHNAVLVRPPVRPF